MSLPKLSRSPAFHSLVGAHSFLVGQAAWHHRPAALRSSLPQKRAFTASQRHHEEDHGGQQSQGQPIPPPQSSKQSSAKLPKAEPTVAPQDSANFSLPPGWEDNPDFNVTAFSQLPHRFFGYNQHIRVNEDFKEALRQILWQFRAPIRYAFAYGSGVFGQKSSNATDDISPHPNPPKAVEDWQKGGAKIIDFIFGVSHTQHWHSLNLTQHPDHYSGLKHLPYSSAAISHIQDDFGAGVYFNPFITVNGVMIKYGVVNLDTLARDLSEWDTLYLAGRLQKPVKILRDDPRIRLANQVNLISALRTALLMLPEKFSEKQLYERIAGLSYMGDPRMNSYLSAENPNKISNIVGAQLPGFRQLYVPLIQTLPNAEFVDPRTPKEIAWEKEDAIRHTGIRHDLDNVLGGPDGLQLAQDMDPVKRGNMVRRLPKAFRRKLYYHYKSKFSIPASAFSDVLEHSQDEDEKGNLHRREGGDFEQRIAQEEDLPAVMAQCVRRTVGWPSTSQSVKSAFTAGVSKSWKYYSAKRDKGKERKRVGSLQAVEEKGEEKAKGD
ncbi:mitochondrial matrix Mmp37 [Teratosphaeria nubilosa]|uniref:Phosphatidate cytidylyltransferase, mitochondrial n=1 Tax=Teratosphaeria nubilosa TaxID=161662 RepID=A0A6G1LLF8_9PEZI|nr:mitochondrial matrix Mmp37 [Teratosphaeria nubilosa]